MADATVVASRGLSDGVEAPWTESKTLTVTDAQKQKVTGTVVASGTDVVIGCRVDQSQIKAMMIFTDRTLTVAPKDGVTARGGPFTILAGQPLFWAYGDPTTCPITGDIDSLVCTNADTENDAEITAIFFVDATA